MKLKCLSIIAILFLIQEISAQGGKMRSPPKYDDVSWHQTNKNDLPKSLDWGKIDNDQGQTINYLTTIKNQHLPRYCGSCWAQAITSSLSDRINIHINKGVNPEISISPQMLVACSINPEKVLLGCSGGDTWEGHSWVSNNYLYPSSCFPYVATNSTCSDKSLLCYDIMQNGGIVKADYS